MSTPPNEALKSQVETVFGQRLTDEQIEASKGRLPTMLDNAHLLACWAGRLGTTGPAQVQKAAEAPADA